MVMFPRGRINFLQVRTLLLFSCTCICFTLLRSSFAQGESRQFICRWCGESIAHSEDIIDVPSKLALKTLNKTVLGRKSTLTQIFENPAGQDFEVATFSKANVKSAEDSHMEATWFNNYAWKISSCPRCRHHLGWKYQPENFNHMTFSEDDTFYGLVMEYLVEDKESDSLILLQHPYR